MSSLKFKTNINCENCIKSVKPFLDEVVGENNWNVDTADERKILTVNITEDSEEIVDAVTDAGFEIEKLNS